MERYGLSASASRTTTGTWDAHRQLEAALALWFDEEDAVLVPAGWSAATAVAQALAPDCDVVLLDDGAHPALSAAAVLTGLPTRSFAHFDAASARTARSARRGAERPLILACALDLPAGTSAPVDALHALAVASNGQLLVDDAHGIGVLGARGRGATEALTGSRDRLHLAGSLAKAFGAQGGFTIGTRAFCTAVRTRATVYTGGTPIPPAVAAGAVEALRIAAAPERRERVLLNADRLSNALRELGLRVPAERVPWFSIDNFDGERLATLSNELADAGFLVPHLRYPGSPPQGLLRITLSAAHTHDELTRLISALRIAVAAD